MAEQTGIQWTDSTWNIVTGCTRVSAGCARCYIERTPPFRMSGRRFETVDGAATTGVTLHWDRLEKVPRGPKVFTPSLGDLFHELVPDLFIAEAFDVMRRRPDRIFQVLTKRPERARDWFSGYGTAFERFRGYDWPLPNVWLGVSIENARYTWRADVLRQIPAAVRFISAEPLLGSLYPKGEPCDSRSDDSGHASGTRALPGRSSPTAGSAATASPAASMSTAASGHAAFAARASGTRAPLDLTGIDWVIIGGESGPKARPFHLEHAREIIQACLHKTVCALNPYATATAYVDAHRELCDCGSTAVFVKQLGAKPTVSMDFTPITAPEPVVRDVPLELRDRKGGDWDEWPADLRIREFPRSAT